MSFGARIKRLREESGAVLAFVAVGMIVFLGMAAYSIDLGRAWFTQRELQRALDASVLAASQDLPDENAATITAHEYGPEATGKNPLKIATATTTTLVVEPRCVTSVEGPCEPFNALHVQGTAEVPTIFAKIFGIDTMTVRAAATACSPCIGKKKLDIVMVLDRTGSMCANNGPTQDPDCTDPTGQNPTDLDFAKDGIKTFLDLMDPSVHSVGLSVLPPKGPNVSCSAKPVSNIVTRNGRRIEDPSRPPLWYDDPASQYLLVPLSADYKQADGSLDPSSSLVSTLNCITGGGRTAYANAIDAAWQELDGPNGRPDAQDVIIFLSDGAANYGPSFYPDSSPYRATPCGQGVASAGAAKTGGALVYSIGYDLDTGTGSYEQCHPAWWSGNQSQQLEGINAFDAIQAIATDRTTFYNKPNRGQLNTIFMAIAADIGTRFSQLIDDDAT